MSNTTGPIKPFTAHLIKQLQEQAAQALRNQTSRTWQGIAKTFLSQDMTEQEEEMFCISLVDLHLFIDTYGAKYVMQELQTTYPNTYDAIAKVFEKKKELKKIAVLLKPKNVD